MANLLFAVIAQMLCGNHLKFLHLVKIMVTCPQFCLFLNNVLYFSQQNLVDLGVWLICKYI